MITQNSYISIASSRMHWESVPTWSADVEDGDIVHTLY